MIVFSYFIMFTRLRRARNSIYLTPAILRAKRSQTSTDSVTYILGLTVTSSAHFENL